MKRLSITLLFLLLLPAGAAHAKSSYYLSLGDSLGAGYQKTSTGKVVFRPGYTGAVYKAAKKQTPKLKLKNLSCPGEDTTTFAEGDCIDKTHASKPSQLARAVKFIKSHKVKLITISLGSNNFTFCTKGESVDFTCIGDGKKRLDAELPKRFKALRKAAGKKTKIAALVPYNPFVSFYLSPTAYNLAPTSNALLISIGTTIRNAAKAQKFVVASGYDAFDSGNFEQTGTFNGQTVPLAVANVCQYTQQCLNDPQKNIHPTDAGYTLLGEALKVALQL